MTSKDGAVSRGRGGRRRRPPTTGFARWLDGQDIRAVADAVGLSVSSLYGVRRGTQRPSGDVVLRLLTYAEGALDPSSFVHDPGT